MRQISGNISILLYLLGAIVVMVLCFSMAVEAHQYEVAGAAQVPRYKADCSKALWYSPKTPGMPCYDVQAYVALTNYRRKSLDHFRAKLTLPSGDDVTGNLVDESSTALTSGSYVAEIWHGKLTQIFVKDQALRTQDNPTTQGGGGGAISVAIPVIAGIVCTLFVVLLSAIFVKGLQDRQ